MQDTLLIDDAIITFKTNLTLRPTPSQVEEEMSQLHQMCLRQIGYNPEEHEQEPLCYISLAGYSSSQDITPGNIAIPEFDTRARGRNVAKVFQEDYSFQETYGVHMLDHSSRPYWVSLHTVDEVRGALPFLKSKAGDKDVFEIRTGTLFENLHEREKQLG